jgi:hypothetical protein
MSRKRIPKTKPVYGWHFIKDIRTLGYGDGRKVNPGSTLSVKRRIQVCVNGLHASKTIQDAIHYAKLVGSWHAGCFLCRVALHGDSHTCNSGEKTAARYRRVVWMTCLHENDLTRIKNLASRQENAEFDICTAIRYRHKITKKMKRELARAKKNLGDFVRNLRSRAAKREVLHG